MKKQIPASYPAPHDELIAAIADCETVATKLRTLETAVRELPGKLAEAKAVEAEVEQKLAHKAVESLMPGADGIEAEIAALEDQANHARAAVVRLQRQSEAFDVAGEKLNSELQAVKVMLNLERNIHVEALGDLIASQIVEKADELGPLFATQGAFARAAGRSVDWNELAHVSDPRRTIKIVVPGRIYDDAPNLLSHVKYADADSVKSIRPALEPLEKARSLMLTREYVSRPRSVRADDSQRRSN